MFFSCNDPSFQEKHHKLVKFILNKEEKYFDSPIKIYAFYNNSKYLRSTGVVAHINSNGHSKIFSEITFPPFGFIMDFNNHPPHNKLYDITHFADYEYNKWTSLFIKMPILPTYSPLPGDYRSENEIIKIMNETKNSREPYKG